MRLREQGRILSSIVAGLLATASAHAAVTAVRFSDLDLRDTHMFVNFLGCRDVTDTPFGGYSVNGNLQTEIQTDADGDSLLDRSYVLLFNDLNPSAASGSVRFESADCKVPFASPSCRKISGVATWSSATAQQAAGTCLATVTGTTRPYTPAVTVSTAPCFVTSPATLTLDLGFAALPLQSAQFGGTFVGNPVTTITNGLLRGFLTEADANATIIPASFPLIGGKPLSSVLRGGTGCCATGTDKDVNNGVTGWWFYFNWTGKVVPWSDPTVSVPDRAEWASNVRVSPNPASGHVDVSFALERPEPVRVAVYDLQGRLVAELADRSLAAGEQRLSWNGDDHGRAAAPGLYVLAMSRAGRTFTRHVALVR